MRQLAEHYHRSPDQLTEEELRQYFLYLANEKKVARATATIALCGIRFFFEQTLRREWTTLRFVRPAREHKLPVVLSRDEVRRVLAAVRIPVYRVCLTTIYACGLRLLEGARLQVAEWTARACWCTFTAKGKQDRYVPLPAPTAAACCGRTGGRIARRMAVSRADPPRRWRTAWRTTAGRSRAAVCRVLPPRVRRSGIAEARARAHAAPFVRHPLLEAGVNLRIIQDNLGHRSPRTTQIYTHLTGEVRATLTDPLNELDATTSEIAGGRRAGGGGDHPPPRGGVLCAPRRSHLCPARHGPCAISSPAGRRPLEATSRSAITAAGRCMAITPAATAIVRSVTGTRPTRWLEAQRAPPAALSPTTAHLHPAVCSSVPWHFLIRR